MHYTTIRLKGFLVIVLCNLAGWSSAVSGAVIHVDDDSASGGDGESWATAFRFLQDALAIAKAGDEIQVAVGTYRPDQDESGLVQPGNQSESFFLKTGVHIMGGYAGIKPPSRGDETEGIPATILSGDLAEDDVEVPVEQLAHEPTRANNSFHVVRAVSTDLTAELSNVTIMGGNSDSFGGGVYLDSAGATFSHCVIKGNAADGAGGGMFIYLSDPVLNNCRFVHNSADRGGAINCDYVSDPKIYNCVLYNNLADHGGGLYARSKVELVNCTLFDNNALEGHSVFVVHNDVRIYNSILWSTGDLLVDEVHKVSYVSDEELVRSSCVRGGYPGLGNINADPGITAEYQLPLHSPCIDRGTLEFVPRELIEDYDGDARLVGCRVDIGADESLLAGPDCNMNGQVDGCEVDAGVAEDCNGNGLLDQCEIQNDCDENGIPDFCELADGSLHDCNGNEIPDICEVVYVDINAPPGGDGSSWESAWQSLSVAIESSSCAASFYVADGEYAPQGSGADASFVLTGNMHIHGGYAGFGAPDPNSRSVDEYRTVLTGSGRSTHVINASGVDNLVVEAVTVTGGNATGSGDNGKGGGLFGIALASILIKDSTFAGNTNAAWINGPDEFTLIDNCQFTDNSGGLVAVGGVVRSCVFIGNDGSGLACRDRKCVVQDSRFHGNSNYGARALMSDALSPAPSGGLDMSNCVFTGNDLAVHLLCADGEINHSSFSGNSGAFTVTSGWCKDLITPPAMMLTNCVVRNAGSSPYNSSVAEWTINYSNLEDLDQYPAGGTDNIDEDPLFVDPAGRDGIVGTLDDNLRLSAGSPSVNAGGKPINAESDADGRPRQMCGQVDIGAYESTMGDTDCNGAIDLDDYALWPDCITGPNSIAKGSSCLPFDFDVDAHVDLYDFSGFQRSVMHEQ